MAANMKLRLLDNNGLSVYEGPLIRLALKDDEVIAKSVEIFRDPEPCMIHRSAIMSRLYGEIMDYFDECEEQERHSVALREMPEWLLRYLELPVEAATVEYAWGSGSKPR